MIFPPQNPVDPTLPAQMDVEDTPMWPLEIGDLLNQLFDPGSAPLLGMGLNLVRGLALIVIAWTGLRIAFTGHFNFWEIVRLIIGISIPLGMLQFYATPLPGVGVPFPFIIPEGADQIAEAFRGNMSQEMLSAQARLHEAWRQNLDATGAFDGDFGILDIPQVIWAAVENVTAFVRTFVLGLIFLLCFILIYALCLAQVMWAQIAIAILVYLGPVLIPWLVFEPMSFLFWGWFKALWTYSLYSIIAGAILRVFLAISITMIESMNAAFGLGDPAAGPEAGAFLVAVVPLMVAAFLAAMKVPELASAIVGSSAGGGGMAGMAATAMTGGKARIAKIAAGGK